MYKTKKSIFGKIMSSVLAVSMITSVSAVTALAADTNATELEKGSYTVNADMSLYVNAMGGIEFASAFELSALTYGTTGIFESATLDVDDNGNKSVTLNLGVGTGSIYSIAFQSFVDSGYSLKYYDANHELKNVTSYTDEAISITKTDKSVYETDRVTSVTFPLEIDTAATVFDKATSSVVSAGNTADSTKIVVDMWMVVNSNVMGLQFCDGSGTAGSNTFDTATKYVASVSIDLASAQKIVTEPDRTTNQSANVEYTVNGGYEIEIPSTITINSATKKGEYTLTAKNFVIGENDYVTVSASQGGKLKSGSDEIAFTNTLSDGKLTKNGDTLTGTVEITDSPKNPGKYTGTIDFTINYYVGK